MLYTGKYKGTWESLVWSAKTVLCNRQYKTDRLWLSWYKALQRVCIVQRKVPTYKDDIWDKGFKGTIKKSLIISTKP